MQINILFILREVKRDLIRDLREVKNLHRSIPLSTHGASIAQPSGGKYLSFQAVTHL